VPFGAETAGQSWSGVFPETVELPSHIYPVDKNILPGKRKAGHFHQPVRRIEGSLPIRLERVNSSPGKNGTQPAVAVHAEVFEQRVVLQFPVSEVRRLF